MTINSATPAFISGLIYFGIESLGGLILIPTMYRHLPTEEVKLWVLFLAFIPLAPLVISGFAPLITREIASADALSDEKRIRNLLKNINRKTKFSGLALIGLLCGCYFFVLHPEAKTIGISLTLGWIFFSIAILARLYLMRSFAIINGFGWVGIDKLQMAIGSIIIFSASIILTLKDGGIIAFGFLHMLVF